MPDLQFTGQFCATDLGVTRHRTSRMPVVRSGTINEWCAESGSGQSGLVGRLEQASPDLPQTEPKVGRRPIGKARGDKAFKFVPLDTLKRS